MKLEDIAKLAGVSISSVSLALNNRPGISEKTRQKILDIVKKNNYIPPKNSNLNIRKVHIMVVQREHYNQDFYYSIFNNLSQLGIESKINYTLQFFNEESIQKDLTKLSKDNTYDSLILVDLSLHPETKQILNNLKIPVMLLNYPDFSSDLTNVSLNFYYVGYNAIKMAFKDHRKNGMILSTERTIIDNQILNGVQSFMSEQNISEDSLTIIKESPTTVEEYIEELTPLVQSDSVPTCFLCTTDMQAINLIRSLNKFNLNVPNDVSIISLENFSNNKNVIPSLSRFSIDPTFFGKKVESQLLEMFSDTYQPVQTLLIPKFVQGESYKSLD